MKITFRLAIVIVTKCILFGTVLGAINVFIMFTIGMGIDSTEVSNIDLIQFGYTMLPFGIATGSIMGLLSTPLALFHSRQVAISKLLNKVFLVTLPGTFLAAFTNPLMAIIIVAIWALIAYLTLLKLNKKAKNC